jgi:hypothetical protein
VDRAARFGFLARALVYAIVAYLAVRIAFGKSARAANRHGALAEIADKPGGKAVLVVLVIGLAGYALWRFSEAAFGKREETDEKKRAVKRALSAVKGALYIAFLATTVSVIRQSGDGGSGGQGSEQRQQEWSARLMSHAGGRWALGAIGVGLIGVGVGLAYRAVTQKFAEKLAEGQMSAAEERAMRIVGTVGNAARGVVAGLIGLLVIKAAVDYRADEAKGVDGTLRTIASRPYGQALLVLTAVGLLAYALFSVLEARYRRLHT